MKRYLLLSLTLSLCAQSLVAQTGDFQLDNSTKKNAGRTYETVPADPGLRGGPLKHLFIGKNYRPEWMEPVRAPVLKFSSDLGGITPKEEGGGRQTRSLQIEDANGLKWVLRSVRKYPDNVVIPVLQGTIAERLVKDGISASFPYSVLSVGTLAKAAGVPFLPNTLVYIPDHPALGEFREKFKNTLSFLERRTVDPKKPDEKTYNTIEVVPEMMASSKTRVDQRLVLKARLLDNFIMDFDRHEDQWEWVKKEAGGSTVYYPVAKDRDQAFFRITGLIPTIARIVQPTLGQLQGLRAKASNIKTFNFVARDFDRQFMNELDEQTWNREVDAFLAGITDAVIDSAMRRQPDALAKHRLPQITKTLKEKRRSFKEDMMAYYRFISETVTVAGTNEAEQFTIAKNSDGTTEVTVQSIDKSGKKGLPFYSRIFSPGVTRELRIYGLEGNDEFLVKGNHNDITVRLIGGPGNDLFVSEGEGRDVLVYDVSFEENTLTGDGFKSKIASDPMTNEYRRLGMQYKTGVPGIGIELTREGGLFLGASYRLTTPGFRKEPYASSHFLYFTRAIASSSYHARYDADFIGLAKKTDLLVRTDATLPTVRTYFFGLGNNTQYNKDLGREFYQAQYDRVDVSVQARHTFNNWLQLQAGPVFQFLQLENERNKGTYVRSVIQPSPAQKAFYDGTFFGGAELRLDANRRNHPTFTTQGMHATVYTRALHDFSGGGYNFRQVGGRLSLFTDFLWRRMIVLATSFGADQNSGKFLFPQAQYLGFRQNLRGYQFQRFAGKSRAYNNTEVRVNLGMHNFYFFKGMVGLIGFHDAGRVWGEADKSETWHRGWGGGLWVAPFNKVAVIGTLASSKEEKSWLQVSFGFQF